MQSITAWNFWDCSAILHGKTSFQWAEICFNQLKPFCEVGERLNVKVKFGDKIAILEKLILKKVKKIV